MKFPIKITSGMTVLIFLFSQSMGFSGMDTLTATPTAPETSVTAPTTTSSEAPKIAPQTAPQIQDPMSEFMNPSPLATQETTPEYEGPERTVQTSDHASVTLDAKTTSPVRQSGEQTSTLVSTKAAERPAEAKPLTSDQIKEINEKIDALYQQAVSQTYVTDLWKDVVQEFEKGDKADLTQVEGSMAYVQMKIGWLVDYEAEINRLAGTLNQNLELEMVRARENIDFELSKVKGRVTKWDIQRDDNGHITGVDWDVSFPPLPRNAAARANQIAAENRAMNNSKFYIDSALKTLDECIKTQNKMSETLDTIQKAFTDKSEVFFNFLRARYKALTDAMEKSLLCIYDADKCEGDSKEDRLEAQKSEKSMLNYLLEDWKKKGDELAKTDAFFFRGSDHDGILISGSLQTVSTLASSSDSDEAIFPKSKSEYDQKDINDLKKMIADKKDEYDSIQYSMMLFNLLFEFLAGQIKVEV